jgi:hypothetical protein
MSYVGNITLDGLNTHFTPSRLSIKPSQSPIVNDVTVLGQAEPQTYMHEYFVGTGVTNTFPLTASLWGADRSVLLAENFDGNAIDTARWTAYHDGVAETNPADVFVVSNNYLNVIGGSGDWLQSVSAIPLEGRLRLTHGEFDFLGSSTGVLGSLWTQEPSSGLTGCLYGLKISGTNLNPIVNGAVDSTQAIAVDSAKRYIIRTVAEFGKTHRVPNAYTYLDNTGTLQSVSAVKQADTAVWQTLISEVDTATGVLTNQWSWRNTSDLNGTTDVFALYIPVFSQGMDLTVGGISVSVPIQATLEASTAAAITNLSFDDWETQDADPSKWYPVGWTNAANIFRENVWSQASNALLLQVGGTLEQHVAEAMNVNIGYNIIFLAQRSSQASSGSLVFEFYGTGWTPTPLTIPVTDIGVAPSFSGTNYAKYEYRLLEPQTSIPADAKFRIKVVGLPDQAVWLDSVTVMSDWQQQLVGPNDMDAMDGQAPVATIVSGNSNSQSKSTYTGAPQYNPGQDQLVFFKNSYTYTSTTPPQNQLLRISYRAAGSAIGRVRDNTSITTEASLWGDNGNRATVRTDLQPRPRTSLECQLAAKAILQENAFQHYEGQYTQFSPYVTPEPRAGMPFIFTNLPGVPFLSAEQVSTVVTTPLCDRTTELFEYKITFGKPDRVRRLLSRIQTPVDTYQQNPASTYADPAYVDIASVALDYIEDVVRPVLRTGTTAMCTSTSARIFPQMRLGLRYATPTSLGVRPALRTRPSLLRIGT